MYMLGVSMFLINGRVLWDLSLGFRRLSKGCGRSWRMEQKQTSTPFPSIYEPSKSAQTFIS